MEMQRATSWTRFMEDDALEGYDNLGFLPSPTALDDEHSRTETDSAPCPKEEGSTSKPHFGDTGSSWQGQATPMEEVSYSVHNGQYQQHMWNRQPDGKTDDLKCFEDAFNPLGQANDLPICTTEAVGPSTTTPYSFESMQACWPDIADLLEADKDAPADAEPNDFGYFGPEILAQHEPCYRFNPGPAPVANLSPYYHYSYRPEASLPYLDTDNHGSYIPQNMPRNSSEVHHPVSVADQGPLPLSHYDGCYDKTQQSDSWASRPYEEDNRITFPPFSPKTTCKAETSLFDEDNDSESQHGSPSGRRNLIPRRPERNPDRPWNRINATTQGKNLMSAKMMAFDAREVYKRFYAAVESKHTRLALPWSDFTYTRYGELEEGRRYTPRQIEHYLFDHPLHTVNGITNRKNGRLILWVQIKPATKDFRYMNPSSSKCRFRDCAALHNTIDKGEYQVCFDEQTWKGEGNDPLASAGWVHLYCLEEMLDLPSIVENLTVRADDRELPLETDQINRMAITPSKTAYAVAKRFIKKCKRGVSIEHGPKKGQPYENWFLYSLMAAKKDDEPPARLHRQNKATQWPQHLGNIRASRSAKAKNQSSKRKTRTTKITRTYEDSDLEDDFDSDSGEDDVPTCREVKRVYGQKRGSRGLAAAVVRQRNLPRDYPSDSASKKRKAMSDPEDDEDCRGSKKRKATIDPENDDDSRGEIVSPRSLRSQSSQKSMKSRFLPVDRADSHSRPSTRSQSVSAPADERESSSRPSTRSQSAKKRKYDSDSDNDDDCKDSTSYGTQIQTRKTRRLTKRAQLNPQTKIDAKQDLSSKNAEATGTCRLGGEEEEDSDEDPPVSAATRFSRRPRRI